ADVVVAEVVVHADPGGRAEADEETERRRERVLGEVEGDLGIEVERAGDEDRQRGEERSDPKDNGDPADRADAPVEEGDVEEACGGGDRERPAARKIRDEIAEVVRQADVARGDLERTGEDELPDEGEGDETSEPFAPERFLEPDEAAAGAGKL